MLLVWQRIFCLPSYMVQLNVKALVRNSYVLQRIIHIIAFSNKAACNSSTGVEMGIPFSFTSITYNVKSYASYMPSGSHFVDITTVGGKCISFQAYKGVESNSLCKDLLWPKALKKEEIPPAFINQWKMLSTSFSLTILLISITEF